MHKKNARSKLIKYNGEYKPLTEWAAIAGVPVTTLRSRLRTGWTFPEAIAGERRSSSDTIAFAGKRLTLGQWARELGLSYATLNHRYRRGVRDWELFFGRLD